MYSKHKETLTNTSNNNKKPVQNVNKKNYLQNVNKTTPSLKCKQNNPISIADHLWGDFWSTITCILRWPISVTAKPKSHGKIKKSQQTKKATAKLKNPQQIKSGTAKQKICSKTKNHGKTKIAVAKQKSHGEIKKPQRKKNVAAKWKCHDK